MATRAAKTAIEIGANESPAIERVKNLVNEFANAATKINQSLELVGKAWGVVTAAIERVVNAVGEYVKISEVQVAAERRLEAAMRMRGEYTREAFEATKALAGELQGLTTVGDEATIAIQSQMLAMGVSTSQMREATEAALGLSAVTGNLEGAAALVAKTLTTGKVAALEKVGIRAKDAGDAIEQLRRLMVLKQAEAQTLTGRWTQLNNAIGDAKEEIGRAVSESDALKDSLAALTVATAEFTGLLSGPAGTAAVNTFFQALAGGIADSINAYLGFKKLVYGDEHEPEWMTRTRGAGNLVNASVGMMNPLSWLIGDPLKDFGDAIDEISGINDARMSEAERMLEDLADRFNAARRRVADAFGGEDYTPGSGDGMGGLVLPQSTLANLRAKGRGGGGGGGRRPEELPEGGFVPSSGVKVEDRINEILADMGVLPTDAEVEAKRLQKLTEEMRKKELEYQREFNAKQGDLRLERWRIEQAGVEERNALRMKEQQQMEAYYRGMLTTGVMGVASLSTGIAASFATGAQQTEDAAGAFFGGLLSMTGRMVTAFGAAALAAAIASKPIPFLWPIFGGPIGAFGALGIMGAGAALSVAGAAMGASASGAAAAASATVAAAGGGRAPSIPAPRTDFGRGFQEEAARPFIQNIYISGLVTDPARSLRELDDMRRRNA